MAFGVVRDGVGIVGDVCLELAVTFSERLDVRIPGLDAFRVGDKVVDAGNGRTDVAVPQEPLDAPQRPVDSFCFLPVVAVDGKALDVLPQHRDAHGDVAPVEHVLGAGRQEFRHAADAVLAVSLAGTSVTSVHPDDDRAFGRKIFLCRYLRLKSFRREVHEVLYVIENWNGANGLVYFGKGGEIATNRVRNQEIAALALLLVHASLVYVNTRIVQ